MLFLGLLGVREGKHLHLVKLMHTENAFRIFPVGTGFTTETGRKTDVAEREMIFRQRLIHLEGPDSMLCTPDKI